MLTVDGIKTLRERIAPNKVRYPDNEQATKMGMVIPFFRLMGYDPNDLDQFVPEYTADFGSRNGAAVDYAIMFGGEPSIIVECKAVAYPVTGDKFIGQLARYYAAVHASVGIITNGEQYHFFADTDGSGGMGLEPYLTVNVLEDNPERLVTELHQFLHSEFDAKEALRRARDLQAVNAAKAFLRQEMIAPDILARDIAKAMFPEVNMIRKSKLEEAIPIIRKAWREIVDEATDKRISRSQAVSFVETAPQAIVEEPSDSEEDGIITTEEELAALAIVREYAAPLLRAGESVEITDLAKSCKIHLRGYEDKGAIVRVYHTEGSKSLFAAFGHHWKLFEDTANRARIEKVEDLHSYAHKIQEFTRLALINAGLREEPPAQEPPAYEPSIPETAATQ